MTTKSKHAPAGQGAKVQRYVDLLSDSGFKAVFGDENNKELIIDFINSVLEDERHVTEIDFLPGDLSGPTVSSKGVRFDLLCTDIQGRKFVVEMQRRKHSDDFFERSIYYGCVVMMTQLKSGSENYLIKPVYVIGIMEDALAHEKAIDNSRLVSRYQMMEISRGIVAPSTINCIFVQLRNFKLTQEKCKTGFERWCYSFKHAGKQDEAPFEDKISEDLFQACEIAQFPEEKRLMYEANMMTELDYRHDLYFERKEGREEGRLEGKEESARNFKALGVDLEIICKATGLTKEQVEAL